MKFLIEYTPAGPSTVRTGWLRVLRDLGHRAEFWDPQHVSAHDAFGRFEPDCFLGTTYGVDDAVEKCLRARPWLRVGLFGSAWGPLVDALPAEEFPVVRTTDDERRRLERLKKDIGQPLFVFIHATGEYLEGTMCGWRSVGIEPVGVLNAADVYVYRPGVGAFTPNLSCDACFVGGFWGYKSKKLTPYIFPLLNKGLNVKIFGRNNWPAPAYLGQISQQNEVNLYRSATVCMNVSEPHSSDERYGCDIIERTFKTMACGGFLVTDRVPEMDLVYPPHCFVSAHSAEDFHELVEYYARNPHLRQPFIDNGLRWTLENHTYHHRTAQLLNGLGLPDEADQCLPLLKQTLGE